MNVRNATAIVAVCFMPAVATAQTSQLPAQSDQTATTNQPQPANQQPASQQQVTAPKAEDANRWVASGFVGSNFANNADPASVDFGGSLAYLFKNQYGAEFDMGFTPNFELQSNFFGLGIKPQVNSFMANAIWAKPVGPDGKWQPFISGGAGALSLRSGLTMDDGLGSTVSADDTRFGGNIGGGLMAFAGNWGFKADVRYYRASGSYNTSAGTLSATNPPPPGTNPPNPPPPGGYGINTMSVPSTPSATAPATTPAAGNEHAEDSLAGAALSGLHFWRANVGVAFRW
jgi:hypothetical protein